MAVVIRLRQQGARNQQTYRLVVTQKRNPRDGKYIEMLGWYNPFQENEKNAQVKEDRISFWISQGAEVTDKAKALIKRLAPSVKVTKEKKAAPKKKSEKKVAKAPVKKAAVKKANKK